MVVWRCIPRDVSSVLSIFCSAMGSVFKLTIDLHTHVHVKAHIVVTAACMVLGFLNPQPPHAHDLGPEVLTPDKYRTRNPTKL